MKCRKIATLGHDYFSTMRFVPNPSWQPDFWRQHPAFDVIADTAARLAWPDWPEPARYYAQLSAPELPVHFADVQGVSYEQHIAHTGAVPTRHANWHDYFNALIWQAFPGSKAALNDLHMLGHSGQTERGRRRDAATLFDENGALLVCADEAMSDVMGEALRLRQWERLFIEQRAAWPERMRVLIFGHGLLDKLRTPYVGITAHALIVSLPMVGTDWRQALDRVLAERIAREARCWTPAELHPLPLLGIPGWWKANEDPAFYRDRAYFRLTRRATDQSLASEVLNRSDT
jgi:hypothetical protein